MAGPSALLWVVNRRPDLDWLVDSFDQLLRLDGSGADEVMRPADVLTAGTSKAAATFEEMVEAMIVAASP